MTFDGQEVKIMHLTSKSIKYDYDDFPSELKCILSVYYVKGPPHVKIYIERSDGLKIPVFDDYVGTGKGPVNRTVRIFLSYDEKVKENIRKFLIKQGIQLSPIVVEHVIFSKDFRSEVLRGNYRVLIEVEAYDVNDYVDAKFIAYGKVHGLFGTDTHRRDLAIGVFWGAPISLAFGVAGGIIVVLLEALLGALGAWWGKRADEIIQRLADIFIIIPLFPILILISFLYKVTIWILLVIIIAFNVVGWVTKIVRPWVMQIIAEQYIEAARSYGASKFRILVKHIIPRLLPYLFMRISLTVPTFIFLEAALCILGLGDPELPTWGRILEQAWHGGAVFHGYWWWILTPAFAICWTATGFALLGYAFDKVTNPRLREY